MAEEKKRVFCINCIYMDGDYDDDKDIYVYNCKVKPRITYCPVDGPIEHYAKCKTRNKNMDCKYYTTKEMQENKKGALSIAD